MTIIIAVYFCRHRGYSGRKQDFTLYFGYKLRHNSV